MEHLRFFKCQPRSVEQPVQTSDQFARAARIEVPQFRQAASKVHQQTLNRDAIGPNFGDRRNCSRTAQRLTPLVGKQLNSLRQI